MIGNKNKVLLEKKINNKINILIMKNKEAHLSKLLQLKTRYLKKMMIVNLTFNKII